jgi:2-C-methyl-D-erythritol 2,4-cyclodiphosphate synthase
MRIGFGYDSHRFAEGRRLVLGGVEIPHELGLSGHSDADVLVHAMMDAILGALGAGDIGTHFPDTDPAYRDASSLDLLARVLDMAAGDGYQVSWVDATLICEKPKLAPHMDAMKARLAAAGLPGVSIKAKTNEGMGAIGRGEGMAACAVCLLEKAPAGE